MLLLIAGASAGGTAEAATGLPPVKITYSGHMSIEVFPTKGEPAHQLRMLSWNAESNSGGSDGALALDFSSVAGSASIEGSNNCYDETTALSLATAKNPVAGGSFLNETSDYPARGWKYIVPDAPGTVPVLEAQTGRCGSFQTEQLPQTNEMLLTQETFTPAQEKEFEALFAPLEFEPGRPATRTRTFTFDGISHCACAPEPAHVKESMTLTVGATSPASQNSTKTKPGSGGATPGKKGSSPPRKRSESLRRALKEQAQEDLGPALEHAWAVHGIATAPALNSGLALSTVLDELGQHGLLMDGDEATIRVINDYRIINDPPARHFNRLAKPRSPKRPSLRSCTGVAAGEQALCTSLRAAEISMLSAGARADAITEALLVTIDRDSGAIRAR
ncbi:MAG TPA: hypothetical protein VH025_08420, partial [Solirubrobacteraceae bacterium]|nr:hypothetical protein [Solirubrobacteraceae bacterium]